MQNHQPNNIRIISLRILILNYFHENNHSRYFLRNLHFNGFLDIRSIILFMHNNAKKKKQLIKFL